MAYLSICIPTYEMSGFGASFLQQSFEKLTTQTFKDFDVVISDHSTDTAIKDLCEKYRDDLTIHYYLNVEQRGNSSANINSAIKHATGTLIKILFQDDFLYDETSLQTIVSDFNLNHDHWLVTSCTHTKDGVTLYRTHTPRYTRDAHLGHNLIGSPSVLTIKNDTPLLFDEHLIWYMDGEYYKRLYDTYGAPRITLPITVVNRIGAHQVSNTIATLKKRREEFMYVLQKYEQGGTKVWYWCWYTVIHYIKSLFIS